VGSWAPTKTSAVKAPGTTTAAVKRRALKMILKTLVSISTPRLQAQLSLEFSEGEIRFPQTCETGFISHD
jgi:hypothetical protein